MGKDFVREILKEKNVDEIWMIARRKERLVSMASKCPDRLRGIPLDLTEEVSFEKLKELLNEETVKILKGLITKYQKYHNVKYTNQAIEEAVNLSVKYLPDRRLPDKAIDLRDEACACASLENKAIDELYIANKKVAEYSKQLDELTADVENPDYERQANLKAQIEIYKDKAQSLCELAANNTVTEKQLAKVIELWTGIPASKVEESDLKKLTTLEEKLNEKIIGQEEATKLVSAAVKRSRVKTGKLQRPASFIFVGPTGVGKTQLVKVLSEQLFDTPETLIRLDMSEFMEKHSVSRLIGSPPGYVGYDEAGQLTEKVRRKPYSIILFDEIEKAHPDVMNILLQILDEGKTNDAHGRTVSFANTVIIMTSNAGSHKSETSLGFGKTDKDISREKVLKALNEFLRPEFIGRVDEIVVFNPLDEKDYKKIAILMLSEIETVLKDKGIQFVYDDNTPSAIVSKMDGNVRGARDLRNVIRRNIEDKVSTIMIDNLGTTINKILITTDDNNIQVNFE